MVNLKMPRDFELDATLVGNTLVTSSPAMAGSIAYSGPAPTVASTFPQGACTSIAPSTSPRRTT